MRITRTITLDAPIDRIVAALLSEELAAKRMEALGVTDYQHKVDGSVAVTQANVPADQLPSKARSFAKNGVNATVTARAAGNVVDYKLDAHGLPVSLTWSITLQEGAPTIGEIIGELKVKVPIVGARVEKAAEGRVDRLLTKEAEAIAEVIAAQEG